MKGLSGKTAIITGAAAKRGIGRATAKRFSEEGVKLIINDVNAIELQSAMQEIVNRGGCS